MPHASGSSLCIRVPLGRSCSAGISRAVTRRGGRRASRRGHQEAFRSLRVPQVAPKAPSSTLQVASALRDTQCILSGDQGPRLRPSLWFSSYNDPPLPQYPPHEASRRRCSEKRLPVQPPLPQRGSDRRVVTGRRARLMTPEPPLPSCLPQLLPRPHPQLVRRSGQYPSSASGMDPKELRVDQ